jgi:hypothetical protein
MAKFIIGVVVGVFLGASVSTYGAGALGPGGLSPKPAVVVTALTFE